MRMAVYVILFCASTAMTEKIIISFKSEQCEKTGFEHEPFLIKLANEVKALTYIGMLLVDIEISKFHIFLENYQEFKNCLNTFSIDQEVKLTLPLTSPREDADLDQWQLKRTNTKSLPLPSTFTRRIKSTNTANVYLLDSGIDGLHPDLKSRIAKGADEHASFIELDTCCSQPSDALCDCGAHGTHCAGLIASPHSGYNPNATLHSVKILDSALSSKNSIILQGMNKVIEISKKHQGEVNIASMSVGGLFNFEINQAANKIVQAKIFLVTSAGNDTSNACLKSPASATSSFAVGAFDSNDLIASFSNFGKCVNIFAPGVDINSCMPGGGYQYLSGTSMATPFVAGFASVIAASLGLTNPADIEKAVYDNTTANVVIDSKSEHNNIPFDGNFSQSQNSDEHDFVTYLK